MEPENNGFQKESPFPGADFQVNHVKLQWGILDLPLFDAWTKKIQMVVSLIDFFHPMVRS